MKPFLILAYLIGVLFTQWAVCLPTKIEFQDIANYRKELKNWIHNKDAEAAALNSRKTDSSKDADIPKPGQLFEGDMIMDEDLRNAVLGRSDKRSALRDTSKRWPHKTIPYAFDPDVGQKQRKHIVEVLKNFKRYTCIKVIPRTTEKAYVIVRSKPRMCASYVGMQHPDRPQYITLGRGCSRPGTILHEFMHALGIIHEQSRPDRDTYVAIQWDHIRQKEHHNFRKYSLNRVSNDGKQYDFSSVMHYGPYAFSMDGSKTIIPKNGDEGIAYGQRRAFSVGDVQEINTLYNCPHVKYDASSLVDSTDGRRDTTDEIEEGNEPEGEEEEEEEEENDNYYRYDDH